jgi:hypothetical protein
MLFLLRRSEKGMRLKRTIQLAEDAPNLFTRTEAFNDGHDSLNLQGRAVAE